MARHLPIPDLPLREIIRKMFVSPEAWAKMVANKGQKMNLDEWQALEAELHPSQNDDIGNAEGEGKRKAEGLPKIFSTLPTTVTPEFGSRTPGFGDEKHRLVSEMGESLGPGRLSTWIGGMSDPRATCFPRWPTWEPDAEQEPEMMLAVKGAKAPETDYPMDPKEIPTRMQHFTVAR